MAAEHWWYWRRESRNNFLIGQWLGKFIAFRHAAEVVALNQSVTETINSTQEAIKSLEALKSA